MKVKTRIAPSPTGYLHLGTARTALFNYAFAKQNNGEFILRIEDTDKKRSKQEYEDDIKESLLWLSLTPDETLRQSDQAQEHTKALKQLIEKDTAYVSKEPAKNEPDREVEVVRLRNPNRTITFDDIVRGKISFDTTELGDFVIARSTEEPLYHFAVVVDDAKSEITHILRGEDHISNTPRQILIAHALGYRTPVYAHLPLILAQDRSKLSKRKHAVAIKEFRARGFLPKAMINHLSLLGWTPPEENLFSLKEFVELFSLEKVHKGAAIFDEEKLRSINRDLLLQSDELLFRAEVAEKISKYFPDLSTKQTELLAPIVGERVYMWGDIKEMADNNEFSYISQEPKLDAEKLVWKQATAEETKKALQETQHILKELPDTAFEKPGKIKDALWHFATERGRGLVLWPLRYALTGKEKSPDPFSIIAILGKRQVLNRINQALLIL